MPGEFELQEKIFMIWPERPDNWRNGGKPAQKAFRDVAEAVSLFEPVTMLVSGDQYRNARDMLDPGIRVVEMSSNDAWARDCGPTFLVNDDREIRAVDWKFNAWGGFTDGLYAPWDQDDLIAQKICDMENVDTYKPGDFVLEGGSIHTDGEGTLLTTEMCLLSPGRNPDMSRGQIEEVLREYLNIKKIIWLKDGIDPEETNGHIDDVACFSKPGEVICIWTEDRNDPFYDTCRQTYDILSRSEDAAGRRLKVHKLTLPKNLVTIKGDFDIDCIPGTRPRRDGDICTASYMNFLIVNGGIIFPQYEDEYDSLAAGQIQKIFPDRRVVKVNTREIVYGGGNIHCITQQMPAAAESL